MANDTIDSAIGLLNLLRSEDEVSIQFIKKDGTTRLMKATLNFDRIPDRDKPKNINLPQILSQISRNKIIRVYDLEKLGWRSIPFDTAQWAETTTKRYTIKK